MHHVTSESSLGEIAPKPSGSGVTIHREASARATVETSHGRSGWYVWLTIVAVLVGVVLVNQWLSRYLNKHTTNLGAWIIHKKWEMLGEQKQPVDFLILGDSTCNQGINNHVLHGELGGSSLNLCTTGSAAAIGEAWMLREYVERVGAPEHVIIGHAYDIWFRGLDRATWANVPRPTLVLRQTTVSYDDEKLLEALLLQNLPLYSQDVTLKKMLLTPIRNRFDSVETKAHEKKPFEVDEFGFLSEFGASPRELRRDLVFWDRRRYPVFISKDNQAAIAEIAQLAEEHDFDVTYVNGPFYDQAYKKQKLATFVNRMADVAKKSIGKHASLRYCKNRFLYPSSQLRNVDHLSAEASVDYTKKVAQLVKQRELCQ